MKSKHCLIVGAGISGLMAGNILMDAGWEVTLIDKGRGVGGRMATRRVGDAVFDHGAQYFTVRDPRFAVYVNQWMESGTVVEWAKGFESLEGDTSSGQYSRYRGAHGMTSIPKRLAERLHVLVSTQVSTINYENNQWVLTAKDLGHDELLSFQGDTLIMTPPAEQTLTLMSSGNVTLPAEITNALASIRFNPCFALLAVLDRPSQIPKPGGIMMSGEPISWMADNQAKGISALPAITIHAGPQFTRSHYETDRTEVANKLIEAARPYIGDAIIVDYQLQRWRYSQPSIMHPEKTLYSNDPGPIAFAGDAFEGARVEGAALSGMAAADRLIAEFQ